MALQDMAQYDFNPLVPFIYQGEIVDSCKNVSFEQFVAPGIIYQKLKSKYKKITANLKYYVYQTLAKFFSQVKVNEALLCTKTIHIVIF